MTVELRDTNPTLLWLLRRAGDDWGPLGVALAAAQLTDPQVVVRCLQQEDSADTSPDSPDEAAE